MEILEQTIQVRIQAIASVLKLFRKAGAISFDNSPFITDFHVTQDEHIDPNRGDDTLVIGTWYGESNLSFVGISTAAIEAFVKQRYQGSGNKIEFTDTQGHQRSVELFALNPISVYFCPSEKAKAFAVETMFTDLDLDDTSLSPATLYDALVVAGEGRLEELFQAYELSTWQPFESCSPFQVVERMVEFAHSFDNA